MMYDLAKEPPDPGTLLESLFLLVSLRRREAELFQTEAMMAAALASKGGSEAAQVVQDIFNKYKFAMFPFLEKKEENRKVQTKELLKHWGERGPLTVKPLWNANANRRANAEKRRAVQQTARVQAERVLSQHKRI